jgi:hypothetical protein|tara:strand:- start:9 stop:179 length:171 start_codon:yes stop_codon:yes gene_type:complete
MAKGNEAIIQGRIMENKKLIIINKISSIGSTIPNLNESTLKGESKASQSIEDMNTS